MIQRVIEQCQLSDRLDTVLVATDNDTIYSEVIKFGGKVYLTLQNHENGTSRCAEALLYLNRLDDYDYVINIQGDEPIIKPEQINELAGLFEDHQADIVTQVSKEFDLTLLNNSNVVKAIINNKGFAINFTRIIHDTDTLNQIYDAGYFYRHIGIYGFKAEILSAIVNLPKSENEQQQHLEQLRWLDNGYTIKVGITNLKSISVDTPDDLRHVEQIILAQLPSEQ